MVGPSAVFDERITKLGPGRIVTAGCVLTVNVTLERFAFINLDCAIGHEAIIAAGSVLNPAVNISGGVKLGQGVLAGLLAHGAHWRVCAVARRVSEIVIGGR